MSDSCTPGSMSATLPFLLDLLECQRSTLFFFLSRLLFLLHYSGLIHLARGNLQQPAKVSSPTSSFQLGHHPQLIKWRGKRMQMILCTVRLQFEGFFFFQTKAECSYRYAACSHHLKWGLSREHYRV